MEIDVDPEVSELFREHRYRITYHATEYEYAEATAAKTDWMLAIHGVEQKAQETIMERNRKK
jgi:hypothetical protein